MEKMALKRAPASFRFFLLPALAVFLASCSPRKPEYLKMVEVYRAQERLRDAYRSARAALLADPADARVREMVDSLRQERDRKREDLAFQPGRPGFASAGVIRNFVDQGRLSLPAMERDYSTLRPPEGERGPSSPLENVFPVTTMMEPGLMGVVFVTREDYGRLLNRISLVYRDNLDYQNPFLVQGVMLGRGGYYREALQSFEMGLKLNDRSVRLRNNIGVTYFRMGLLDNAKENFEKALELDAANLFAQVNLGWTLLGLNQGDAARRHFRSALNLQPESPELNVALAYLNFRQGDYDAARDLFQKTLSLNPTSVDASYSLGSLKVKAGDWGEAARWFEKTLGLDSARLDAYVSLGGVYSKLGRYDKAEETLLKAVELEPGLPGAYYNLACLYAIRNDPVRAMVNLRKALEKGFAGRELLLNDPDLENIRKSPGFSDLLQGGK